MGIWIVLINSYFLREEMDQLHISSFSSGLNFYWFFWANVYPLSVADL